MDLARLANAKLGAARAAGLRLCQRLHFVCAPAIPPFFFQAALSSRERHGQARRLRGYLAGNGAQTASIDHLSSTDSPIRSITFYHDVLRFGGGSAVGCWRWIVEAHLQY